MNCARQTFSSCVRVRTIARQLSSRCLREFSFADARASFDKNFDALCNNPDELLPNECCSVSVGLADNAGKPYIPTIWRYFLDFLAIECKPDELWSQPGSPASQKRKMTIEVAAAHADTIACIIKSNERCNNDIEVGRIDLEFRFWFPNSEPISGNRRFRQQIPERHITVTVDYRRKNALFCAPGALDDSVRIDLVPCCQIAGDRLTAQKVPAV